MLLQIEPVIPEDAKRTHLLLSLAFLGALQEELEDDGDHVLPQESHELEDAFLEKGEVFVVLNDDRS